MRLIITQAIGDKFYGQLALNLCLSIKSNNPDQKILLIYTDSAIKGLEDLFSQFTDYGVHVDPPIVGDAIMDAYEFSNYNKVQLYKIVQQVCPEFEQVIYLDADTLIVPGRKPDDWFDKLNGVGFTAYCNDVYDFSTHKKKRKDGDFYCDPEDARKYWFAPRGRNMPQVKSTFLYFEKNAFVDTPIFPSDNGNTGILFDIIKKVWVNDDSRVRDKKGVKSVDGCINIAVAYLERHIHQIPYRPIYYQVNSENRSDEYVLQYYRAIGLDSQIYYDTRLLAMYNRIIDHYRSLNGIKEKFHYKLKRTQGQKKVYGFWHICMINHFLDIAAEQLTLINSSGLYDKCEAIYVGCVGGIQELEKLKLLFSNYPKIRIQTHKTDLQQYEFPTLRLLEAKAKERNEKPFYAFYIHSKGVTYPNEPHRHGGDMFRAFLNHFIINKWEDCLSGLIDGKDVSGAGFIPEGNYPKHFRGNFWWADSDYIKTLPPIDGHDLTNRYNAEFWIGQGNMDALILNENVIDYETATVIVPQLIKNIDRRTTELVRPFGIDKNYWLNYWKEKDITVVVCQRKTLDTTRLGLESFLQFYPDIPILFVDGDSADESLLYLKYKALTNSNIKVWERPHLTADKHSPHGTSLHEAIRDHVKTKYVLTLDNDIIVERGGFIEPMLEELKKKKLYCIGGVMITSRRNECCGPPINEDDEIRTVHPSTMILDRDMYLSLPAAANHGAPYVFNMIAANDRGLGIGYFPVDRHVSHLTGSWCETPPVWRSDLNVRVRPFVTFILATDFDMDGISNQIDTDFDCLFVNKVSNLTSVMHDRESFEIKDSLLFDLRLKVSGEYVCVIGGNQEVPDDLVSQAKWEVQSAEEAASSDIQIFDFKFVKRQVWQQREALK